MANVWKRMTDEQRASAIKGHCGKTYVEMGKLLGASPTAIGEFARAHGLGYESHRRAKHFEKLKKTADRIAPYWAAGVDRIKIAIALGISSSYLDNAVYHARLSGDKRFPEKKRGASTKGAEGPPAKPIEGDLLPTVARAMLREHHPDGTKYTPRCIIDAMHGRTDPFKVKRRSPAPYVARRKAVDPTLSLPERRA